MFLVEDPSGWTNQEIARRNRELLKELREAFHGDESKLERYQNLCGEFLRGSISAALFYDISINVRKVKCFHVQLLGLHNLRVFSHLISLIDDPKRRHVIETLFREARGEKTSMLDREFLRSIGANERQSSSKALTADSREFLPRVQSAAEFSRQNPVFPEDSSIRFKGSRNPSQIGHIGSRTPNDPVEDEVSNETPSEQLEHLRQELSQLGVRKSHLVERRKVVSSENLWNSGNGGVEVIRCLDETLRKRALKEDWEGVDLTELDQVRKVLKELNERELVNCDWVKHMHIDDASLQNFRLFLEYFKGKESLQVPSVQSMNRAKRDFEPISAKDLNRIRETFVVFVKEIISRLSELTKSVEEDEKRRFAAVVIPEKPREPVFAKAVSTHVKKDPWKVANSQGSSVPDKAKAYFPAMKEVYPTKSPRTINGKPVKIGKSPVQKNQGFFPMDESKEKSIPEPPKQSAVSKIYAPPLGGLSEKSPSISPEVLRHGNELQWGVKKDPLQEAMENAAKDKKKGKGKGKNKPCVLFQY